jgi:hypothetical protein
LRYNQDYIDFCTAFEEKFEECMQAGIKGSNDEDEDEEGSQVEEQDTEEQVAGEEMVHDSLPDVGLPFLTTRAVSVAASHPWWNTALRVIETWQVW